jgi:hypothetical protein
VPIGYSLLTRALPTDPAFGLAANQALWQDAETTLPGGDQLGSIVPGLRDRMPVIPPAGFANDEVSVDDD